MVTIMEIEQLRASWNDVLNHLEQDDRIAWMAFFDARLAELHGSTLTLDFSDSNKFATSYDYGEARTRLYISLQRAIRAVIGVDLILVEKP
jgi:hypothetical protein